MAGAVIRPVMAPALIRRQNRLAPMIGVVLFVKQVQVSVKKTNQML